MKKIKIFLPLSVLFVALLFTISCERDDTDVSQINQNTNHLFNAKYVSRQEINQNRVLLPYIEKIASTNNSSIHNRDVYNSQYDFTVDIDSVKYVESIDGNFHSYTFNINPIDDSQQIAENLVLSLQPDGTYLSTIMTYQYKPNNIVEIGKTTIDLDNIVDYLPNQAREIGIFDGCIYTFEYFYTCGDCDDPDAVITQEIGSISLIGCYDNITVGNPPEMSFDNLISNGGGGGTAGGNTYIDTPNNPLTNTVLYGSYNPNGGSSSGIFYENQPIATAPILNNIGNSTAELANQLVSCAGFQNNLSLYNWISENRRAAQKILDFVTINNCSSQAQAFAVDAMQVFSTGTAEEINALNMTFAVDNANLLSGPYDLNYINIVNQYTDLDLTNPLMWEIWKAHFSAQCAIIRHENSNWSERKIYWEASKEMVHLGLDIAGMTPVVGAVFDAANAVIYTIEGDGLNATLSTAAIVPGLGQWVTSAKYARKTVLIASGKKVYLRIYHLLDNTIKFSGRSQLRKVLGIVDSSIHAHHIIPYSLFDNEVVQMAAKYTDGIPGGNGFWHINDVLNGIGMPSNLHLTGHSIYLNRIIERLNLISTASYQDAYNGLVLLSSEIKILIQNFPNATAGEIATMF